MDRQAVHVVCAGLIVVVLMYIEAAGRETANWPNLNVIQLADDKRSSNEWGLETDETGWIGSALKTGGEDGLFSLQESANIISLTPPPSSDASKPSKPPVLSSFPAAAFDSLAGQHRSEGAPPWCTAQQMRTRLVSPNENASLPKRRYNAGCKYIGSNYRCKMNAPLRAHLADESLRAVPYAAASGECSLYLNEGVFPFPAGSKILFWGNSHMREAIHAINCQYPEAKFTVHGSNQDQACKEDEYKLQSGQGEIIWRTVYENNATVFGVCNCGLMYDRSTAFDAISRLLGLKVSHLTHVIANAANTAGWAAGRKYKACSDEPWLQKLANMTRSEKFNWTPFPTPDLLASKLRDLGFVGKLIWTAPMWCKSTPQQNRYRWPAKSTILEDNDGEVAGYVDFSNFICPLERAHARCAVAGCDKGGAGSHQCLPGPPDDMAAHVMHLLHTL